MNSKTLRYKSFSFTGSYSDRINLKTVVLLTAVDSVMDQDDPYVSIHTRTFLVSPVVYLVLYACGIVPHIVLGARCLEPTYTTMNSGCML